MPGCAVASRSVEHDYTRATARDTCSVCESGTVDSKPLVAVLVVRW
jgi:hypothetical protein